MKSKFAVILLLLFFGAKASAVDTIYCSHPELCRMLNRIIKYNSHDNNPNFVQTESLVTITGDPHEYEPSVKVIKKLITAPVLLTGPNELNPWIKKINFQRSKIPNLQTVSIIFDQKDLAGYSEANREALSHFWLYPRIYCSLKSKLEIQLKNIGHPFKLSPPCDFKKEEDQLRSILIKIKKPIILTHDALLPLFLNLTQNGKHSIVAIKGSGHHEEANPESIKKMYNALVAPKVIWIQETGINIPQNIINKMRANDIVIKIDTASTNENEAFSVLSELTEKLRPYAEKLP